MPRVILITGSGLGKSYIGNLLAAKYKSQGIACKYYHIGSRFDSETIKTISRFTGYIIIETNLTTIEDITPWQIIDISGGR